MDLQKIDRSKGRLNINIACAELRCYRCIIVVGPTHCYSTNPNPNHSQSCSERSKGSRKLHRLAAQLNFHLCVGRPRAAYANDSCGNSLVFSGPCC
jgi:hypothetical protein